MKLWGSIILTSSLVFAQNSNTHVTRIGASAYECVTMYQDTVNADQSSVVSLIQIQGKVFIRGTHTSNLRVRERMTIKAHNSEKAQELAESYRLKKEYPESNHYKYEGYSWYPLSLRFIYEVDIPANAQLTVETSGGDLQIQDTQCVLDLETSGGDIELDRIIGVVSGNTSGGNLAANDYEGVLNLKTSGGNIDVNKGSGPVDLVTSGGDIQVGHITGDIFMKTSGGSLKLENVNAKKISGETSGGNIWLETVTGDINVSTSGGHIDLKDISGSIEAKTSGGNINAIRVDGPITVSAVGGNINGKQLAASVKATTIGGNIRIIKTWNSNNVSQSVYLENSDGNIYLEIPEDFPADIQASVKGSRRPNSIVSDIPLDLNYNHNSVSGQGVANQGTYSIQLNTSNGQIVIKEER